MQESCQEETGGEKSTSVFELWFPARPGGVGRPGTGCLHWLGNTDKWPFLFAFADRGPGFGEEGQGQSMQGGLESWKLCQGLSLRDGEPGSQLKPVCPHGGAPGYLSTLKDFSTVYPDLAVRTQHERLDFYFSFCKTGLFLKVILKLKRGIKK